MHKFGVWAPKAQKMSLKWRDQIQGMNGPNKRGWWTLEVPEAGCGDKYAFLLDDEHTPYPDPRSLRQPEGVHNASETLRSNRLRVARPALERLAEDRVDYLRAAYRHFQ